MDRNLRAFLAVAKAGNLTLAADRIGLTQPALTKTIRRLEQEFGAPLFDRTARGMVLTAVGRTLLERARLIEMHYQQAHEEVRAASADSIPEFRIGAGVAYHHTIGPDLVRTLADEFPETRFVLDLTVAGLTLPRLFDSDIDLVLGAFYHVAPEGIETVEFLRVDLVPVCCRTHPLVGAGVLPPAALRDARWIHDFPGSQMSHRLEAYCAEHLMPRPRVVMEIESLPARFRIIRNSRYLTLAPVSMMPVAEAEGLGHLSMQKPIWTYASGAWFRASSRRFAVMRRALEVLGALTRPAPAFPEVMELQN